MTNSALFLYCALAASPISFTKPDYRLTMTESKRLEDWIKKYNPDVEVFIHPNPQRDKLKEYGWERIPLKYKDNEIWIQRKPARDTKTSA